MKSLRWIGLATVLASSVGLVRAEDAAKVFSTKCAMCHGKTGLGNPKMAKTNLLTPEILAKTDAELIRLTTDGIKPKMPAFKGKVADIAALVAYVRSLAPSPAAAPVEKK